jgi:60 kDa SS-A/Ro ribonucleoprotein
VATYSSVYSMRQTPQTLPIPGRESEMAENNAGGYSFVMDDWKRLQRFLIMGSPTTYYQSAKKLSRENAECVVRCIKSDGVRTVNRIVTISDAGRAPKNSPALYALALCAALGDATTKNAAWDALPKVARTGTHLFEFIEYYHGLRGWSRASRNGIASWYHKKSALSLAYQVVKYQSREKWSHRDVLRLIHAKPHYADEQTIFNWIVKGWPDVGDLPHDNPNVQLIWAFEKAKRTTDASELVKLIVDYRLPREAVPTQFLTNATVWYALLQDMPFTAMLRNLGTMSKVGLLTDGSDAERHVVETLGNVDHMKKARVHPIAILSALRVYEQGHGVRSQATWTPARKVSKALDAAFYKAFNAVEPTGKNFLLAVDISGSMNGGEIAGVPGLTPREAAAALALVTASTEPNHGIVGFCTELRPLEIRVGQKLSEVVRYMARLPMGGTDCALPMIWAQKNQLKVDVFVTITDGETWAGNIHPKQALASYRKASGVAAKSVMIAVTSTGFSLADPKDVGMLDCVGMDVSFPTLLHDFVLE